MKVPFKRYFERCRVRRLFTVRQIVPEVAGAEIKVKGGAKKELQPKLFMFGSGYDFDHNFGSGSSSSQYTVV